jgi:hypothetical protein
MPAADEVKFEEKSGGNAVYAAALATRECSSDAAREKLRCRSKSGHRSLPC